jgi:chloride channel protein, CIC family
MNAELTSRAYLRTLVIAALIGLPVAFAAVLFLTLIHEVIDVLWSDLPDGAGWDELPWWYVIAVPAAGGVLAALALRLPGRGGHPAAEGLSIHPPLPAQLPSILAAALASLGFGLVLGPEAPMIALGLTLGLIAARALRAGEADTKLLALAGAFGAISTLFGGPLVAALLLFEIAAASGMFPGPALGRALLPGFVAAGTGALVFTGVGGWPGVEQAELSLPGLAEYDTVRLVDIGWCLLVAVVAGGLGAAAVRAGRTMYSRVGQRPDLVLPASGLLVGALAVLFRALTDDPVDLVLFSGQEAFGKLIAEGSAGVLLAVLVIKAMAYTLSLGAGFRGGPIFPAITLGVAAGALAAEVLPGLETTPAVLAGVAAGAAGPLRLAFSGALMATLLGGSAGFDAMPIIVLASVTGWLVALAVTRDEAQENERP